jgi:hypothetical protein
MRLSDEKGIALLLSLFLIVALSVVAGSLMFLAQTETYSSLNYRLMSQARYGAEAGLQRAANHLMYSYTAPTATGSDAISAYNYVGVSPVTYNGRPVVLSANPGDSNYPVGAVQAAFAAAAQGTLPSGSATVQYSASAELVSMKQIKIYGGLVRTIQTWKITSQGAITTGRDAAVEVSATLETLARPTDMFAAFATSGGCGALNFHGNTVRTDSYDSSEDPGTWAGTTPDLSASEGSVGTNGNLTNGGGSTINGSLSTPRVGVGNCSSGNVTALDSSGGAAVTDGVVQLPQEIDLPPPDDPNPMPPTTSYNGNGQTLLNGALVGNVSVNAGATLTLGAVGAVTEITMNSLTLNGNATIQILGTVVLHVAGQGETTPLDLTGGSVTNGPPTNPNYDPTTFQIQYGGTGTLMLNGGAKACMMVYAPDAQVVLNGNGNYYGSIVGATVDDTGGAKIHYDRNLQKKFFSVGNPMLTTFSWSKF